MKNQFLSGMLDEIERLRGLLSKEHASTCVLLRSDTPCNCGATSAAAESLVECSRLRAQLAQAVRMMERDEQEIARLDLALAQQRAENQALTRMSCATNRRTVDASSGVRYRAMQRTMIALLLLAGCGTTGSSSPSVDGGAPGSDSAMLGNGTGNQSGARIKLRFLESGDGARLVTGTYDAERGEDCTFRLAGDGKTRCLPNDFGYVFPTNTYYSDSGCSSPALAIPSCGPPPKYAFVFPTSTCTSIPATVGPRVYELGTALSSAYRPDGVNGECTSTGTTPETSYYALGAEVPASAFEAAEEKIAE